MAKEQLRDIHGQDARATDMEQLYAERLKR